MVSSDLLGPSNTLTYLLTRLGFSVVTFKISRCLDGDPASLVTWVENKRCWVALLARKSKSCAGWKNWTLDNEDSRQMSLKCIFPSQLWGRRLWNSGPTHNLSPPRDCPGLEQVTGYSEQSSDNETQGLFSKSLILGTFHAMTWSCSMDLWPWSKSKSFLSRAQMFPNSYERRTSVEVWGTRERSLLSDTLSSQPA